MLKDAALKRHPEGHDFFNLQSSLVNEHQHWISTSKKAAIWFDKKNEVWRIGLSGSLGKDVSFIKGPFGNDDCLFNIAKGWRWWNGDNWTEACNGEILICNADKCEG